AHAVEIVADQKRFAGAREIVNFIGGIALAGRGAFQIRDEGLALGGQVIIVAQAGSPAWGGTAVAARRPRNTGPDYQSRSRFTIPSRLPINYRPTPQGRQLSRGGSVRLERSCIAIRLAGSGAECRFPAAELLPAVIVVVAGRDQGGVPRTGQYRRQLRSRGAQPEFGNEAAERGVA